MEKKQEKNDGTISIVFYKKKIKKDRKEDTIIVGK